MFENTRSVIDTSESAGPPENAKLHDYAKHLSLAGKVTVVREPDVSAGDVRSSGATMKIDLKSGTASPSAERPDREQTPFEPQVGILPTRPESPVLGGLSYPVLDFGSMSEMPRVPYLVDGMIAQRSVAAVYGRAGVGKSFFNIHLAFSIACGIPWLGRDTVQGPVLYVVAEGEGDMSDRINGWMSAYGARGLPQVYFLTAAPQLNNPEDVKKLITVAQVLKPILIIIDPLAQCTIGVEENSSSAMGTILNATKKIATAVGCSVLLTHHTARGGSSDPRGSSAIEGAVDTAMLLTRRETSADMTLESRKVKYYRSFPPYTLRLQDHLESQVVAAVGEQPHASKSRTPAGTIIALKCLQELGGSAKSSDWQELWKSRTNNSTGSFDKIRKWLVEQNAVRKGPGLQDPYHITVSGGALIPLIPNNHTIASNVEGFQSSNSPTHPLGWGELNESNNNTDTNTIDGGVNDDK
ncbi:MAG: AAA family ATPase [Gemmatimonadaceae bacterium]